MRSKIGDRKICQRKIFESDGDAPIGEVLTSTTKRSRKSGRGIFGMKQLHRIGRLPFVLLDERNALAAMNIMLVQ